MVERAWWILLALVATVAPRMPHADAGPDGGVLVEVVARDRAMTGIYKVYAAAREFPDRWLAGAIVRNVGPAPLTDVAVRFRCEGLTDWSAWSDGATCRPGDRVEVPYHPVFDRRVAELQSSTPIELKVEWRCRGADGPSRARARTPPLLGGREFVFSDVEGGRGTFAENFSNAPFLAAWVSRDDPVIKQYAALVSRNVGGVAAIQGIEQGLETLRASYELMLLNDFVYKSPVAIVDPTLSFDSTLVQNLKYPRDVLRDKSGTCIELAILHAAIAHPPDPRDPLVHGHCYRLRLTERDGDKVRCGASRSSPRHPRRTRGTAWCASASTRPPSWRSRPRSTRGRSEFLEVDVEAACSRDRSRAPPLPTPRRWGITAKGLPGMTLPDLGNGATKTDLAGFGGTWKGTVRARFGGPDVLPHRVTLVVVPLRGQRYKLLATFEPEGGGATIQEESVAEDQEGQLVFQGKSRTRRGEGARAVDLVPGRGAARVKDGKLTGKYGADGEGFTSFALDRA
jgi:hypothetical protein